MFEELAGIDIKEFEETILKCDDLPQGIKFATFVLIQRYKKLIDCNLSEYKILCKCMGGTNQLLEDIENNFRFEDLTINDKQLTIEDN